MVKLGNCSLSISTNRKPIVMYMYIHMYVHIAIHNLVQTRNIDKKEVGIAIKSKETSSYSYLAKKLLATHSTGIIDYYL